MDSLSLKKIAQHLENPEAVGMQRPCTGFPGLNGTLAHRGRFVFRKLSERHQ